MTPKHGTQRVALVTGGSRGLGYSLVAALVGNGWRVITDARDALQLSAARATLPESAHVIAKAGDVADVQHRRELVDAVRAAGRLDLLVNNAGILGPSPQPRLADYPLEDLERVYAINTFAPVALLQDLLPYLLRDRGRVINISSDAAVEPYEGWAGYGSSKAALDHLTAILGVEQPQLRVYAFDPGDMATAMHQLAFPGEDISDRPHPDAVVPALLRLVDGESASGRYRASELALPVPS